jgi:DNA-binding transcriptional ArsR family regulator
VRQLVAEVSLLADCRTGYVAYLRQGRPIKRKTRLLIWIGLPLLPVILLAVLFLTLIHEPSRSIILAILCPAESADFLYFQRETGLTRGNLSVHLSKLEEAGYVSIEKTYRGKIPMTLCRMMKSGRQALAIYHKQLKQFVENTKE